jgi:hypothetical protein
MFSGFVASKSKHGIYGLGWSVRLGGCTPLMLARRGTGGSRRYWVRKPLVYADFVPRRTVANKPDTR